MSKYDFTVDCSKVSVEYASINTLIEVSVVDVEFEDIVKEIGVNEVLDHITHDDIKQYVIDNNIDID